MIRGLLLSGAVGTVLAFAFPQDEVKVEQPAQADVAVVECDCVNGGPCICGDDCECPNCLKHNPVEVVEVVEPVKQPEPVVQIVERTVENKFDATYIEDSLANLRKDVDSLKTSQLAMAATANLNECKCEGCLNEEQVRAIVKEEIKAHLTLKTANGTTRTQEVKVVGGSSEFIINPGEILTHIDGVPVSQGQPYVSNNNIVQPYGNPQYQAEVPRRVLAPTPVRIFRSGSNCANGQCGF